MHTRKQVLTRRIFALPGVLALAVLLAALAGCEDKVDKRTLLSGTHPQILYVSTATGVDTNTGSTADKALASIQAALAHPDTLAGHITQILVAAGNYTVDSSAGTHLVLPSNLTLKGGWDTTFTSYIPATTLPAANTTVIQDSATTGGVAGAENRVIEIPATSTGVTVLGFTLQGGGGDHVVVVLNAGGGTTLTENIIQGGTAVVVSRGVLSTGTGVVTILHNRIDGGTANGPTAPAAEAINLGPVGANSMVVGNLIRSGTLSGGGAGTPVHRGIMLGTGAGMTTIANNRILGGTATGVASSQSQTLFLQAAAQVVNNTIEGGSAITIRTILIGANGSSFINNLVTCQGTGTTKRAFEETPGNPKDLQNNNLAPSCTTALYYDSQTPINITAIGNINGAPTLGTGTGIFDGNVSVAPVFVNPAGGDYHLDPTDAVELRQGGLDRSTQFQAQGIAVVDLDGIARTATLTGSPANVGAAGWSMGAYELD